MFGEWDSPFTDDMEQISTPIGSACWHCGEAVIEGEHGARTFSMGVVHRECSLRSVMGGIGHLVDHAHYCSGPLGTDAGLTHRQSALLVWALFVERQLVTDADLSAARDGLETPLPPR